MRNAIGQEFSASERALNAIADAMLDPDGPGNLTEAVYLSAENLSKIAATLELDETLDKIGGEIQCRLGEIAAAINNLAEAIRERPAS